SNPPGKPGRKKNPNSQAARRDQNRIAQREFRLRKQQRIRDLEATVEILSGGKDEALSHLRKILKDLMQENQVLRDLLRSLSSFIGDGAGGLLPKLGWDLSDFNNFINRSETDTAWESYQRHKQADPVAGPSTSVGQKRSSPDDPTSLRSKRPRGLSEHNGDSTSDSFPPPPVLVPLTSAGSAAAPNGLYPSSGRPSQESNLLSELMRGPSGSPMFIASSPANASSQFAGQGSTGVGSSYPPSYMPPMTMNSDPGLPSVPLVGAGASPFTAARAASQPASEDDDLDPKKIEAYKLIHYHLDNYKRNSAYCLPSSLRPTLVQRTVPHGNIIDSILHPELRDRMILLRGRFDLVDCLHDYRNAVNIHGDDVLAHGNWEITENWLQRYKFLVDQATLNITNRWRRDRGESELRFGDFTVDTHATST
ncbi:hypothetical protein BKA93DRAFT_742929, partial [Sparassis latifolia]